MLRARAPHGFIRCLPHRQRVVPVHIHTVHAVSGGPLGQAGLPNNAVDARGYAEMVVFADEHHRQIECRGRVHRFMERAFIGGPVSEKVRHHVVFAKQLQPIRRTHRDGISAAHDTVGAQYADIGVRDVHGTALALAVSRPLAVELRHHPIHLTALGDEMPMAAMRARDIILFIKAAAYTRRDRFLPDVQMHEAGYLPPRIQPGDALLKTTDLQHGPVYIDRLCNRNIHIHTPRRACPPAPFSGQPAGSYLLGLSRASSVMPMISIVP